MSYKGLTEEETNFLIKIGQINKPEAVVKKAAVKNEEFQVDEDATVSNVVNGAYVQCWLWVDAETKPKRSKRTKA